MLNNRKIRLMTQLAIYEKHEGKEDIKLSHFYSSDYARLQVLKTAIMLTVSYICLIGLVGLYRLEYLLDNALTLDYFSLGWLILGIYIGLMTVYLICTLLGYSIKYKLSRKQLSKHYRMLSKLSRLYDEEDGYSVAGQDDDDDIGYTDENEGEEY